MELEELLAKANDSMTVGRVFGTPIERDGMLVIPVASVQGGGGGGSGTGTAPDGQGEGTGTGGGWGVRARPVGVFVVRDGNVQWVPAIDYARFAERGGRGPHRRPDRAPVDREVTGPGTRTRASALSGR